jgi:hypothetical protein
MERPVRPVAFTLIALLAAATGAAWLTWGIERAPRPMDIEPLPDDRPPAPAIEPAVVDMGELVPGQPVSRTVTIVNRADVPITVVSAQASCGCTTPTWPRDPIPPGGRAEAQVTVEVGDSQGERLSKQVMFLVDVTAPAELAVIGTVGNFVSCAPRTLDAPADDVAAPAPSEVVLESLDGTAFRVDEVDPPIGAPASKDRLARHVVAVDWSAWRASDRPMHLAIATDHPKAPVFGVVLKRAIVRAPTQP